MSPSPVGAGGARSKGSGGRMGMDGGGSPPGKPFFSIFVARPTWWPYFKRDPRPAGTDHAPTWKQKACLFPPRAVVRPRGAQIELVRFARPAPRGGGPCPDLETKGLFVSTSGHGPSWSAMVRPRGAANRINSICAPRAPRGRTMPRPGNKRPICFHVGAWSAPGGPQIELGVCGLDK